MDRFRAEQRRRLTRWVAASCIAAALVSQGNARAAVPPLALVPGQALIRFEPGAPAAARALAHARAGARVERRLPRIGYDLVSFAAPLDVALASYRADPWVARAEPNHTGRIALSPSDACHASPCDGLPQQWHHLMTNTPFGWDAFPGRTYRASEPRPQVTIAVLDTKIDASHPDWVNAGGSSTDAAVGGQLMLDGARDWVPASRQGGSAAYHGTFVAGLAAAATGNARGAAGVGYVARVLPLTVVDGSGWTNAADLAEAIVYAWQRGARIINLSLGLTADSSAVRDAIRTVAAGTASRPPSLVVAAAGNNTGGAPFYPGSYPEVMSVSGTDAADRRAPCSNHNANVSVSAPADRLVGLSVGGATQAPCGTSAAAPQVSGLAALLFAQDPSRTPARVRAIIERAADDLGEPGRDQYFGAGRINVERALRSAGPVATAAAATVAPAAGGTITVTATATSPAGVRAAQVVFGAPGAPPVAMRARDGSFGGTTEALVAEVRVPGGTAAGAHPIWVRAADATTWGPATVGVAGVDGRAPTISGAAAQNAVRATGQPFRITFGVTDDYASRFVAGIEVRNTATGAVVWRAERHGFPTGTQVFEWTPALTAAGGHHTVTIAVADEAGNVARATVGALVT